MVMASSELTCFSLSAFDPLPIFTPTHTRIHFCQTTMVRLELLSATLKLFFQRPPEVQAMLGRLMQFFLDSEDLDPDLNDRTMMYYRMLTTNPEKCQTIVTPVRDAVEGKLDTSFFVADITDDTMDSGIHADIGRHDDDVRATLARSTSWIQTGSTQTKSRIWTITLGQIYRICFRVVAIVVVLAFILSFLLIKLLMTPLTPHTQINGNSGQRQHRATLSWYRLWTVTEHVSMITHVAWPAT